SAALERPSPSGAPQGANGPARGTVPRGPLFFVELQVLAATAWARILASFASAPVHVVQESRRLPPARRLVDFGGRTGREARAALTAALRQLRHAKPRLGAGRSH